MADTMSDTVAPAIPPKHPGRLSRIYTTMGNDKNKLSRELIDLWEHGALLYHSYEWQEAAETFLYLSRVIEQDMQSTFCLLNAVIIFARLGDYRIAAQVLEEAKRIDETLALTLFIMGHIEFQLDHFDKSEDCFRAALSVMQGPNLKFARHGFDFTLWTSQIREDLLVFDGDLSNVNAVLASFPADALFEAPSRSSGSAATSLRPRKSFDSGSLPTLSEGSESPVDELPTPEEEVKALRFPERGEFAWQDSPDAPEVLHAINFPKNKTPVVTVLGGENNERPSSRASKIMTPLRRLSQRHNRSLEYLPPRRLAFAPRDARVQGDSVQELSEYIRDLPARHGLKPRTAEAEYGDVRDLSKFLREGPPRSGASGNKKNVKRAASQRSGSSRSALANDYAESIDSNDLIGDWESFRSDSGPSTPSRLPYRSGLGSALMKENAPGSQVQGLRHSASQRSQPSSNTEPREMLTSVLHPLLTDSADDYLDSSWPLTPGASEMLANTPPCNTAMQGSSYFELPAPSMSRPSIPKRNSSLTRPSPLTLPNITEQDDLEGWTGTPNRLSTYQFMMRHGVR